MDFTPFCQSPPELGNQYAEDRALRSLLRRVLPEDARRVVEPELMHLGALAGGDLYRMQLEDRRAEPVLTPWDAWGNRIDRIEVSPLWKRAERLSAELGLVATAHERKLGGLSRVHQFALVYLFGPSTDVYACPLAMTDGAARTLVESGHPALNARAVPRLTSRDPETFWTSGQWMTESTGGSDVGRSETRAVCVDGTWRLWGRKWFTSATTSQVALTLARPEGNGPGGKGLALFYLEPRDAEGRLQDIVVHRLKDKLGTRKVPTAELSLHGTPAIPVAGLDHGVRAITPMLNVTRTWNTVMAAAGMRRAVALARDYARRRVAFQAPLSHKPLHVDTLAWMAAESEAALHIAFRVAHLLGRADAGEAAPGERVLARLLTPIAKLVTGKQAVAVASEALECFGGAGFVEDTGLPMLLRDAQVLPIWEGTTNVLSLDTLRAFGGGGEVVEALEQHMAGVIEGVLDPTLRALAERARGAVRHACAWVEEASRSGDAHVESGARRFSMTLGRALGLLWLADHAGWSLREEHDGRARLAALRFARSPFDLIEDAPGEDMGALAREEPEPA